MWRAIVVALLLLAVVSQAFAAPWTTKYGQAVDGNTVGAAVQGEARKFGAGTELNIVERARERLEHGKAVVKAAHEIQKKVREAVRRIRASAQMVREKVMAWQRVRQMCQEGNTEACDMYLGVTKEMILTALDHAITQLEQLAEINVDVNLAEVNQAITVLESYKELVQETSDLNDLREIYPEIRKVIRDAIQLAHRYHALVILHYTHAYTYRLQSAALRVERILERLRQRGIDVNRYEENISEILQKLTNLEQKVVELKDKLIHKEITAEEYAAQLREIKAEIYAEYKQLRNMIKTLLGVKR